MSWISYRQFLFRSAGRSQRALSEHNQGAPVGRVETLIEAHENAFLTFGSGRRRNLDRESRVRTGLFPGGKGIRTLGPARRLTLLQITPVRPMVGYGCPMSIAPPPRNRQFADSPLDDSVRHCDPILAVVGNTPEINFLSRQLLSI